MTLPEATIRCEALGKRYAEVEAVRDVSFALARGRFLAFLGPSGCGKTTTLRMLAGFEVPDSGRIWIGEQLVAEPGRAVPPERRRIGMVFQDYALFPHMSVERNVAYGLPRGTDRKGRVAEVLELVGLGGLSQRMPHELSGGQQQRVALARALAPEPAVVLLDEPFSNLDAHMRARVRAEVREILSQAGATAIFVTHDQEEALSLADEVAVMLDGVLVQCAAPEEIYLRPATRSVATFVGEANMLPGEASGSHAVCALGNVELDQPASGPVDLMIRPEALVVTAATDGPATVVDRSFYGHDQAATLRYDSGLTLRVRSGPERHFRIGQRVALSVRGPVVSFSHEKANVS